MKTIMLANFKGGPGKTTLAHHLAIAATEQGMRVLAVDTDPQGDLYRRLAGHDHRDTEHPPTRWAPGCVGLYSPGEWSLPSEPFDLVIVDTRPDNTLPTGPRPDVVVIPIEGVDSALNANDTIANALAEGAQLVVIVKNGTSELGPKYAKKNFGDLGIDLPARVVLCDIELPRAASIKRSGSTCEPAWRDAYKDAGAKKILAMCKWVLARVPRAA